MKSEKKEKELFPGRTRLSSSSRAEQRADGGTRVAPWALSPHRLPQGWLKGIIQNKIRNCGCFCPHGHGGKHSCHGEGSTWVAVGPTQSRGWYLPWGTQGTHPGDSALLPGLCWHPGVLQVSGHLCPFPAAWMVLKTDGQMDKRRRSRASGMGLRAEPRGDASSPAAASGSGRDADGGTVLLLVPPPRAGGLGRTLRRGRSPAGPVPGSARWPAPGPSGWWWPRRSAQPPQLGSGTGPAPPAPPGPGSGGGQRRVARGGVLWGAGGRPQLGLELR